MSLLQQDIIRKEQVDKNVMELEFDVSNNEKYKVKTIWKGAVYTKESKDYLPSFYYLIALKGLSSKKKHLGARFSSAIL